MKNWKKINDTVTIGRLLNEKAQKWFYESSEELYTDGELYVITDGGQPGSDAKPVTIEEVNETLEQYADEFAVYYVADDEYADAIYGDQHPVCMDEAEVKRLSKEWGVNLFEQMHEADDEELEKYGVYLPF